MQDAMGGSPCEAFKPDQRVHPAGDSRRVGTVKYVGPVEGHGGIWVGVDWDNGEGKHDGSINGVRYFRAKSERSGSFVRIQSLSGGISLLEALYVRYRGESTKEEEDDMYVLSTSNKRVSVELVGMDKIQDKLSRFEELKAASLPYLGVSSLGEPCKISATIPNLKELDLTGNLLSEWKDIGMLCETLPTLTVLNLSNNSMRKSATGVLKLYHLRVLVLNNTGISWEQVEMLKESLPSIEELHLMGNNISTIESGSSFVDGGFDSLQLLNLENNSIADWEEIVKLSKLTSLEQIHLNKNKLKRIFYPGNDSISRRLDKYDIDNESFKPFQNLRCLLLGGNCIEDLESLDSLNYFPKLVDIRLSENPITDPAKGGVPRFVLVARLARVEVLNGSEVRARERKESEIRYVRLVMSRHSDNPEEMKRLHPRFMELKDFHGIEDERPSVASGGPKKMSSGLISIALKCIAASMGEKPLQTKKLPATTTVGKLKLLSESIFNMKSTRPKLYLQEEGSPLPMLLDDDMASLVDLGIDSSSIILIDEES
ncbi:hypothetical protein BT93_L0899 [Corymbia citriodora subsp. variegata]|uniref:CAP-Gly domain-containing protein n=1 Tax=Corymbia citriodora subsp. variegata TaxID=360336 RepID=A0A8T0CXP8_CORYI|nr:hypothetical protein BT93_L0899 [Corymbia citriodora subsp. variegata]